MRKPKGQVALGLAFSFTAVLAVFGLVFNSSLITREKMQLQQTTDFAALVAADVQRHNLNRIRDYNEGIETAFEVLQSITMAPIPMCALKFIRGGTTYVGLLRDTAPYTALSTADVSDLTKKASEAASEELRKSGEKALEQGDKATESVCSPLCHPVDAFYRNLAIRTYSAIRMDYAAKIMTILQDANKNAFEYAMSTYLLPDNLPIGLRVYLEERLGRRLTPELLRSEYEKGSLKDKFQLVQASSDTPLFLAEDEMRQLIYWQFRYDGIPPNMPDSAGKCWQPTFYYPIPTLTMAKVSRGSGYTTSFVAGASYTPPDWEDVFQKFRIYLTDPANKDPNKLIRSLREDERLFSERHGMHTLALAKPYGGKFPVSGNVLNPLDHGDLGAKFEGAKLIGINDRDELGGFDMGFTYQKEFLH
ncbi:MAG TPA: Tad domain-containing protein [Bdellovibrionota bacterium]|nr:Tad domain-containing protein [Bdellovibrionota bacterium]